ncbi:myosin-10-like [Phalaenopsis equestris]|uniref:myosin-10-like n=1 Tax=Phalaenopsis equestris TaxID=78828 RepID=UPI0009E54168|nr:myosin-10-like [Phalaenopsis equestris]
MAPISKETEDYIRESIEGSAGLPISEKTLKLKLLASEEDRRLLRDQNFMLQDRLREINTRFQSCKEEARMNARGLRKCIKDKETIVAKNAEKEKYCAELEKKCMLFQRELDKYMESCGELEKENYELRAQLQDISSLQAIFAEVQSLQKDKDMLLKNLQRAEEEVKLLYKENRSLDEENKWLQRKLQREQKHHRSEHKHSTRDSSSRGKRKSRQGESKHFARETDIDLDKPSRQRSHCYQNSPQSKRLKR